MSDTEERKKESYSIDLHAHIAESGEEQLPKELITNKKAEVGQRQLTKEERINFEAVVRYRCRWCGKEGLKTPYRHKCKFNPEYKNCFSCRYCKGVEVIHISRGEQVTEQENQIFEFEKRMICEKTCDPGGKDGIRTLWKLSLYRKWKAMCPEYLRMDFYEGKDTYVSETIYRSLKNQYWE